MLATKWRRSDTHPITNGALRQLTAKLAATFPYAGIAGIVYGGDDDLSGNALALDVVLEIASDTGCGFELSEDSTTLEMKYASSETDNQALFDQLAAKLRECGYEPVDEQSANT